MIKLSKEQCNQIRESVEFQILVAQATNTSSISVPVKYGLVFMSLLEERMKQKNCHFCHEDREGYTQSLGAFHLSYDRFEGWLLHAGKSCKPRPIKYCPLCGRELLTIQEEFSNEQDK